MSASRWELNVRSWGPVGGKGCFQIAWREMAVLTSTENSSMIMAFHNILFFPQPDFSQRAAQRWEEGLLGD